MTIVDVVLTRGRSGYLHIDLAAVRRGAIADGGIYRGAPVTPGFRRIVEPAETLSILLVLDDGQVACGDCVDVIFAGAAGRDRVFHPGEHVECLERYLVPWLKQRDAADFRGNAEALDAFAVTGRPVHAAVRYGLSQALLHAAALAQRRTMAGVIAAAWRCAVSERPIPMLANCQNHDIMQLDRMILKRVDLLPHAYFTSVANELGADGQRLVDWLDGIVSRIDQVGDDDYRPRIHIDVYGTIGELCDGDVDRIVAYLARLRAATRHHDLIVESPIIAASRDEQIDRFARLRESLRARGVDVPIIADEWCNTHDDIMAFIAAQAADFVQVKTPDLGGIQHSIAAVLDCRAAGMGVCLGGTGNETDHSARICAHVALATQPDFMLAKPGLGGDEAVMIQANEMARALALLAREVI